MAVAVLVLSSALIVAADSAKLVAWHEDGLRNFSTVMGVEDAYLLGGTNGTLDGDQVLRFDPRTAALSPMAAHLPRPSGTASTVWTGAVAYVFGAHDGSSGRLILRYDPAADIITTMEAKFPGLRRGASAVWTGTEAYVFGGNEFYTGQTAEILRYDPVTDALDHVADLPSPRKYGGSVWDGRYAWIFGGTIGLNIGTDEIVRFDPETFEARVMAYLPDAYTRTQPVWTGSVAYLLGGTLDDLGPTSRIVRFIPASHEATTLDTRLPYSAWGAGVIWDGHTAWMLGGVNQGGNTSFRIVQYDPGEAPVAVIAPVPAQECVEGVASVTLDGSASFDPDGDAITFSWEAPGVTFDDPTAAKPTGVFPLGTTSATLTVATSPTGGSSSARVDVVVRDTLPPSISFGHPMTSTLYVVDYPVLRSVDPRVQWGTIAVGHLTVVADAQDQCEVASVTFSSSLGTSDSDTESPFEFASDPTVAESGHITVSARATDAVGFTTSSSVEFDQQGTRI